MAPMNTHHVIATDDDRAAEQDRALAHSGARESMRRHDEARFDLLLAVLAVGVLLAMMFGVIP